MEFKKEKVYTPLVATPTHNVSQAIKYGNLVFISGISWPMYSISPFWRALGYIFPSTMGVQGFARINTTGATLNEVAHEYQVLWIQAGVYFITACLVYRYQIIRSRKQLIRHYLEMKRRRASKAVAS